MQIKIQPNEKVYPPGKLADAEIYFDPTDGPLDGLKLIGFGIWERRDGRRNVTFPARQYSVNGERRSFALLRPIADITGQDRIRDLILAAYAESAGEGTAPASDARANTSTETPAPDSDTTPAPVHTSTTTTSPETDPITMPAPALPFEF